MAMKLKTLKQYTKTLNENYRHDLDDFEEYDELDGGEYDDELDDELDDEYDDEYDDELDDLDEPTAYYPDDEDDIDTINDLMDDDDFPYDGEYNDENGYYEFEGDYDEDEIEGYFESKGVKGKFKPVLENIQQYTNPSEFIPKITSMINNGLDIKVTIWNVRNGLHSNNTFKNIRVANSSYLEFYSSDRQQRIGDIYYKHIQMVTFEKNTISIVYGKDMNTNIIIKIL